MNISGTVIIPYIGGQTVYILASGCVDYRGDVEDPCFVFSRSFTGGLAFSIDSACTPCYDPQQGANVTDCGDVLVCIEGECSAAHAALFSLSFVLLGLLFF